jgi:GxxExxY protein
VESCERLVFRIVEAARAVHLALGPGFIESIYSRALIAELKNNGFQVEREKAIKIWYASIVVGKHLLDLVVDGTVIVELKANRGIVQVHMAQMNSYLHATNYHRRHPELRHA